MENMWLSSQETLADSIQEVIEDLHGTFGESTGNRRSFVLTLAGSDRAGFFSIEDRDRSYLFRANIAMPMSLHAGSLRCRVRRALHTPAFNHHPLAGRIEIFRGVEFWRFDASLLASGHGLEEIIRNVLTYAEDDLDRLDVVYGMVIQGQSARKIGLALETIAPPMGHA